MKLHRENMSEIQEVETNHGKRSVICDNFAYRLDHYLQGGNISWRCTQKRCKARIRTNEALTEVTQRKNEHTHEADERKIERQILRARSKRKAVEDTNEKLSKIVCSELENVTKQFLHPADLRNITKAMSRLRRKHGIGRSNCSVNGIDLKLEPKPSVKKNNNSSPDLSGIIKVEPVDAEELLENDGLEVPFRVSQDEDGSGKAEGGRSREAGREKGAGGMDIMELFQGAHHRFESQQVKTSEARGSGATDKSSDSGHKAESSTAKSLGDGKKPGGEAPVLQELFKSARLNQQRQQKTGVRTDQQTAAPPPDVSTQSLLSSGESETETGPRVTDPYSLLASGGMTVQEFERRQRHPYQFRQEELEKQQQQGDSTSGQQEDQGETSALELEPDAPSILQSLQGQHKRLQAEGSSLEIPSTESGRSPTRTVELLTPSDFEKRTSISSRQKAGAARQRGVIGQPDILLTPQDFTSPFRSVASAASLSRLSVSDLSSPASPEIEPLTRPQFQQAVIHMIRTDEEFVNKLHEAYLDCFLQLKNKASKR